MTLERSSQSNCTLTVSGCSRITRRDLLGDVAQRPEVLAGDAELQRKTHGRPVLQAQHAAAHRRELAVLQRRDELGAQRLAFADPVGGDDELRERRRRQLLVERQVEARAARADVAHEVVDALWMIGEHLLHAAHLALGRGERRALGELEVDQQFQPRRRREELLRHVTEAPRGDDEHGEGRGDHQPAPADAPVDRAPEARIEPAGRTLDAGVEPPEHAPRALRGRGAVPHGQQPVAEIRDHHDRRDPRDQQRDGDDLEDRPRVLAGRRMRRSRWAGSRPR